MKNHSDRNNNDGNVKEIICFFLLFGFNWTSKNIKIHMYKQDYVLLPFEVFSFLWVYAEKIFFLFELKTISWSHYLDHSSNTSNLISGNPHQTSKHLFIFVRSVGLVNKFGYQAICNKAVANISSLLNAWETRVDFGYQLTFWYTCFILYVSNFLKNFEIFACSIFHLTSFMYNRKILSAHYASPNLIWVWILNRLC